jgi:hypothetical protein
MPAPADYEAEYQFWPWGRVLRELSTWIAQEAPRNGTIFDYMCGTGYLLHQISRVRPDLTLTGCDASNSFIEFGRRKYPHLALEIADAVNYHVCPPVDIVVCAAGVHHLATSEQVKFLNNFAQAAKVDGWLVIAEECIGPFSDEVARKVSVLQLWSALLVELFNQHAPESQLDAALSVLRNDLLQAGEFKSDLKQLLSRIGSRLRVEKVVQVWPPNADFGDVLIFAKAK